ncbi:5-methyltetrahydropteroyltriglutamate-homocysteine methyltransferase, putative [Bodo saltans]|uniref:5-methyltetrahydropteroyltriglutamate--homocysteine S-methyltransferase n=1 Tax=Bodo saltans TaxID=75058 RepID=A0A0S4IQ60_BODSA|nr:5-methyltetrahydropteroyltriglutamate-homocysteine methyltransferase, putative [Bodo saltans]|eukprot:CUF15661.1 5-methyltetrahydropteroyltriglutamate-homocysteine methyltransferase, putative [Bodo saltans]
MAKATNLGFPRVGVRRELKTALEAYWKGSATAVELLAVARELRARHWALQRDAGLEHVPSNDFTLYDHVLDMSCLVGCVPPRYQWDGGVVDLDTQFAMARGRQVGDVDVTAMEMTKWLDTNYHFLVPEFAADQTFKVSSTKVFDEFEEALALGVVTRPVLVGPLTYVTFGKKAADSVVSNGDLIARLTPVFIEVLQRLAALGAVWVQIDEPALVLDCDEADKAAARGFYDAVRACVPSLKVLVATYFDTLRDNAAFTFSLPVAGVHIDLCRGEGQANTSANDADAVLDAAVALAEGKVLSMGVVDGRNIWRNDLSVSLRRVERAVAALGVESVFVAGSCSLLHSPVDLAAEGKLDEQLRSWMAFATQKLGEIKALSRPRAEIGGELAASDRVQADRRSSTRIHDVRVKARVASLTDDMARRQSPFSVRRAAQRAAIALPSFPTTTIGSFPQTPAIRKARAALKRGELTEAEYSAAMEREIQLVVDFQHEVGLDVLVHGEPERNDMVEYFGEQLSGFTFTQNGWVQSYGSRCVKPPVIFGDVSRAAPMTVRWSKYAQSLTTKPMKGMLTGPITIVQWSFVRDDQPRQMTSRQIALAIRDEVVDLEVAGIRIIQIDEAAVREGLPLRRADWPAYLTSAVTDFGIAASGVQDATQIHTHMCYSEFNTMIGSIAAMDADAISIECSRSKMELLDAFASFKYPNEIGPGVYDIHSPRVPTVAEIVALLVKAVEVIDPRLLWVNPDCGLKTRGWAEVKPALVAMVQGATELRALVQVTERSNELGDAVSV